MSVPPTYSDCFLELAQVGGIPPRSDVEIDLSGRSGSNKSGHGEIKYVEAKVPDWRRLAELGRLCVAENQWTNSGPLSLALERIVSHMSGLPGPYRTVMANSGTAALYAAAGIFSRKAGRSLRWAISTFGFAATRTGPFANMTVPVDCDASGFLDLSALEQLPDDAWDGVLVTRVFGLQRDMSACIDFCRRRGKPLIIDAALSFPGPRHVGPEIIEIVSFHHTKPWGFGEAGCLFVLAEDEKLARSVLNFGYDLPSHVWPGVSNGKLSDLAAAAIIDRLERMHLWAPGYRAQYSRIMHLVEQFGLEPLGVCDAGTIAANVPVLAPNPISLQQLPDAGFDCGKYYPPLSPSSARNAFSIYERIINIPCHGDMAYITDDQIAMILTRMARV